MSSVKLTAFKSDQTCHQSITLTVTSIRSALAMRCKYLALSLVLICVSTKYPSNSRNPRDDSLRITDTIGCLLTLIVRNFATRSKPICWSDLTKESVALLSQITVPSGKLTCNCLAGPLPPLDYFRAALAPQLTVYFFCQRRKFLCQGSPVLPFHSKRLSMLQVTPFLKLCLRKWGSVVFRVDQLSPKLYDAFSLLLPFEQYLIF